MTNGFAVKWRGDIRLETVATTSIAAKVNGIVTLGKMMVFGGTSDNEVNEMFGQLGKHAELVEVSVSEINL